MSSELDLHLKTAFSRGVFERYNSLYDELRTKNYEL